jgi:outer membrane protein TolC
MFVASMRWNLFDGWRSREMEKEAQAMGSAAKAQRRQMENAVSLQVRKAQADYRAAQERIAVTEAVIAQSEESLRILRNRYSNGLATLSDVLRAETASTESRMRRLSAVYDERMAAVMLEQAAGILNGESNVLK